MMDEEKSYCWSSQFLGVKEPHSKQGLDALTCNDTVGDTPGKEHRRTNQKSSEGGQVAGTGLPGSQVHCCVAGLET